MIINAEECWCANTGDCKIVINSTKGSKEKNAVAYHDLTRDHKAGKQSQQDEKIRINNRGYKFSSTNKIVNKTDEDREEDLKPKKKVAFSDKKQKDVSDVTD